MEEIIWKIIYVVFWISSGLVRMPHGKRYKKTVKKKSVATSREIVNISLVSIGMMLIPMVYVFSPWLDSFNMGLPDWARWIGAVASVFALILFWQVHKTLGRNWSPVTEIREDHKLVTAGPYRYVRHPMYTYIWIWLICQWLILSNWVVGVVGFVTWSILFFVRLPDEERMMVEEFGQEYIDYMKRTRKVVPWVY